MASVPNAFLTPEEYLRLERAAEYKSEYLNGQMFAMSGASRPHSLIAVNTTVLLQRGLKGQPCETYSSDMRVLVNPSGLYTYPDVSVVCGKPDMYLEIASLKEYLLITQHRVHVHHGVRQSRGWLRNDTHELADSISLTSLNVELPLREIYYQVEVR